MKVKYNARKLGRINYKFMGFTTFEQGWWYDKDLNSWTDNPDFQKGNISSHQSCKSMKAFRRKLKRAPNGVEFVLVSRWIGHDIIGKGSSKAILSN